MNCKHNRICRQKFCSWLTNSFCLQILPTNQLPLPKFIGRKLPVKNKDPVGLCPSVFWTVFSTLCVLFTCACQMFYVAECCSVVQCAAVCCRVLSCVVVCCSVLQCVAACRSVLQCLAVCCSASQCVVGPHPVYCRRNLYVVRIADEVEVTESLLYTKTHQHTLQHTTTHAATFWNADSHPTYYRNCQITATHYSTVQHRTHAATPWNTDPQPVLLYKDCQVTATHYTTQQHRTHAATHCTAHYRLAYRWDCRATATRYSTLQHRTHAATHCIASHIAEIAEPLQHATAHCNTEHTLQRTASPRILQRFPSWPVHVDNTCGLLYVCGLLSSAYKFFLCTDSVCELCIEI